MKKSIIEEVYNGKRGVCDTIIDSELYRKMIAKSAEVGDRLLVNLSEEKKKLYFQLGNLEAALEADTAQTHFVEGFKLGLCIAIECLIEK